ncbi:MAG: alpha/beta hydrolase [Acidimicrobiia bacterium]|nr:alpha/beta hydrolase [Acidimicrobiia bacterium]
MALKAVADGIFAESYGSWPPRVVALHGWARRGNDFDQVLSGLDAVAVDLPGFGASPPPSHPMAAHGYAGLLRPFLEQLPDKPVLVGHSFGGRIAACLAAEGMADALVLTGVPLLRRTPAKRPPLGYRLIRWANRIGIISDRRLEEEKRRRGSEDYRTATGVMRDVLVMVVNETYEEQLRRIRVPVSLVWGADDTEVGVDIAVRAQAITDRAELHVLEGVGHLVPTSAPQRLRAVIDSHLGP